jgi:predicted porin
MNKHILVAAIATAIAAPMVAHADATLYGKVRVATQYHDRSNLGTVSSWGLQDQVSRLGIKGSENLGGGLKAVYKMEFGITVGDGAGTDGTGFGKQRNAYVGLAGGFGTVLLGRHDTPFKMSTGKLDFFGDTNADMDSGFGKLDDVSGDLGGVGLFDSRRVDGVIAYVSPDLQGVTIAGAIVQTSADAQFEKADDIASAYSVAAMYKNGPFLGSLAYESLDPESLAGTKADDYDKWRIGLGVSKLQNFSASLIYEEGTNTNFAPIDTSAWQLQLAYDLPGMRLKAMYGEFDGDNNTTAALGTFDTWAIGLEQNLSKRTDMQVLYRQKDADNDVTGMDDNVMAIQLNHEF